MKVAIGNYFNFYSEPGYDNYGLKNRFDIMIVFPEWFELNRDITMALELMLEKYLKAVGNPAATEEEIKEAVGKALNVLDYEYERIIVNSF